MCILFLNESDIFIRFEPDFVPWRFILSDEKINQLSSDQDFDEDTETMTEDESTETDDECDHEGTDLFFYLIIIKVSLYCALIVNKMLILILWESRNMEYKFQVHMI